MLKKAVQRWLGLNPDPDTAGRESSARTQLAGFREDTQLLTTAVEFLALKLNETVTRDEVTEELNARLDRLETAHAGALSGTKNQMRRTRSAAMTLWALMLLVGSFFTVQVHDLHVVHCALTPPVSAGEDFLCKAAFPFADHSSTELLHELLNASGQRNSVSYPDPMHYEHAISPRVTGAVGYGLLLLGAGYGITRYRQRTNEEREIEVGDITEVDLDALRAAQDDGVVAPGKRSRDRREPTRGSSSPPT